jgi:diguanylate cyclase (GGDEF)-like protein
MKNSLLIIEDSTLVIASLTGILETDYTIFTAATGAEGIKAARDFLPDVIISGIMMPDMDGYNLLTILKEIDFLKKTPVIFITGSRRVTDEEKGLTLGCADYITKPFSNNIVKLRIKKQIDTLRYIRTLESLSTIDRLTRLPDRNYFEERLRSEWNRAIRLHSSISAFVAEIDHLKIFYDTYGPDFGDIAVQTVAKLVGSATRRPADFVARWNEDEFVVLLPETDLEGAFVVAEQLRLQIEKTPVPIPNGKTTHVTVSIGVNTRVVVAGTIEDFVDNMDDALLSAKKEGRNRVSCYFSS